MTQFDELLDQVRSESEILRMGNPPDIARVQKLVGAMGQSFTTTMFAMQQANTIKEQVVFIAAMAEKYPKEEWVKVVAAELFRRPIGTLRTRFEMIDTAAIREKAAGIVNSLSSEQLLTLSRRFIEHHEFLIRRLRDLLPFHELGVCFEGYKVVTERVKISPKGKGSSQGGQN